MVGGGRSWLLRGRPRRGCRRRKRGSSSSRGAVAADASVFGGSGRSFPSGVGSLLLLLLVLLSNILSCCCVCAPALLLLLLLLSPAPLLRREGDLEGLLLLARHLPRAHQPGARHRGAVGDPPPGRLGRGARRRRRSRRGGRGRSGGGRRGAVELERGLEARGPRPDALLGAPPGAEDGGGQGRVRGGSRCPERRDALKGEVVEPDASGGREGPGLRGPRRRRGAVVVAGGGGGGGGVLFAARRDGGNRDDRGRRSCCGRC